MQSTSGKLRKTLAATTKHKWEVPQAGCNLPGCGKSVGQVLPVYDGIPITVAVPLVSLKKMIRGQRPQNVSIKLNSAVLLYRIDGVQRKKREPL